MTEWTKERILGLRNWCRMARLAKEQVCGSWHEPLAEALDEIERLQGELEWVKGEKSLFARAAADNAEAIRQAVEQEREKGLLSSADDQLTAELRRRVTDYAFRGELTRYDIMAAVVCLDEWAEAIRNRSQEGR